MAAKGHTSSACDHIHTLKFRLFFTGNWRTAVAHIITAVIGSGVLSLGWAVAQASKLASTFASVGSMNSFDLVAKLKF